MGGVGIVRTMLIAYPVAAQHAGEAVVGGLAALVGVKNLGPSLDSASFRASMGAASVSALFPDMDLLGTEGNGLPSPAFRRVPVLRAQSHLGLEPRSCWRHSLASSPLLVLLEGILGAGTYL